MQLVKQHARYGSMMEGKSEGREPDRTEDYLLPSYWNARFRDEEKYDWFKGYSSFKHLLQPHLKTTDRILILGCGNSSLTADLWKDGFQDITSIDLSEANPLLLRYCHCHTATLSICQAET